MVLTVTTQHLPPKALHSSEPLTAARWSLHVAALTLVCVATSWAGPWLNIGPTYPGLLWLATAISMAAMLQFGTGIWPGAWAGMTLVGLWAGLPEGLALALGAGNSIAALAGAIGLNRLGSKNPLEDSADIASFALLGVCAVALISASNATLWLLGSGAVPPDDAVAIWCDGWLADSAGVLVLGVPMLTRSRSDNAAPMKNRDRLFAVGLGLAVAVGTLFVQLHSHRITGLLIPLFFLPHLLLAGLTARSGLFAGAAAVPLTLAAAVFAGQADAGSTSGGGALTTSLQLWSYALTLTAIPLLVHALMRRMQIGRQRWRAPLEACGLGIAEWTLPTRQVQLSSQWLEMLGYRNQSLGDSLDAFWERFHPDDLGNARLVLETLQREAIPSCRFEVRLRRQDERWLQVELNAIVVARGLREEPLKITLTARDLSERLAAAEHRTLARSLFQQSREGLVVMDGKFRVIDVNPMYTAITGIPREQAVGKLPALLGEVESSEANSAQQPSLRQCLDALGSWTGELFHRRADGEACTLQVSASAVLNDQGALQNHVLAISDITQQRQQIEQLRRQAHYDELTGLPNRAKLTQILMEALATSEREGSLLTVCFLDLDYFKPINDQLGHHMGDQLLVKLAGRLGRALRTRASGDDVIARIGGDEFVLLLHTATQEESRQAVERLLRQVHQPFALDASEDPVHITASIGATIFPIDQADAETLLRHADHAMYGAKQAGRNGYQFFDAEHDRRTEARFVALGRIQEALDAQELCLYFQPKVDMRDGQVVGVEALLRWNHPEQGLLLPAQFLPLIEHTGLAVSVGNWVLQRGIEQLAQWQSMGLDLTVSINVSARHLQEPMFARHLALLLSQQSTPVADRLILEILETTALADMDYTCDLMQECRALGVRFALDDFGTGYSTLTYLKRLPLDMLKIDRSFVINMLNDRHDLAIVEGVIGLSETFGCSVVAEGVDTLEQAQRLIEIGCDIGQGNGIAPAMPADEVVEWIHSFTGISTLAAPLLD